MLALWEYFWVDTDWTGAAPTPTPTPTPTPVPSTSAGGGGKKKHRPYERVGEDFWILRERYLRRFAPKPEPMAPAEPIEEIKEILPQEDVILSGDRAGGGVAPDGRLLLLQQALQAAIAHAHKAQSAAQLQYAMQRAQQLQLDISKLQQQNYSRAIALLLLDAF